MFTGVIQGLGTLVEKRPAGGGMIFGLEADFQLTDPEEGESIAVNGACLTARNIKGRRFFWPSFWVLSRLDRERDSLCLLS